jgi:hypothetical protein
MNPITVTITIPSGAAEVHRQHPDRHQGPTVSWDIPGAARMLQAPRPPPRPSCELISSDLTSFGGVKGATALSQECYKGVVGITPL